VFRGGEIFRLLLGYWDQGLLPIFSHTEGNRAALDDIVAKNYNFDKMSQPLVAPALCPISSSPCRGMSSLADLQLVIARVKHLCLTLPQGANTSADDASSSRHHGGRCGRCRCVTFGVAYTIFRELAQMSRTTSPCAAALVDLCAGVEQDVCRSWIVIDPRNPSLWFPR
jgi:hypothetical protein